jgi:NAD(P)-dependent dehydrogenase (short-subunit alcohol dehydrogenase family)
MKGSAFDLSNRVALITGAGRGIGLAIAQSFAAAGAAVAIQDIELEIAKSEAQKITDAGSRAMALGGDVGNLDDVSGLIPQVVQNLGSLDILVNNAAIQFEAPWLELKPEQMEEVFRADLAAPLLLCQQAVRIFAGKKWGRIINIGSVQQRQGSVGMLPYSLAKAAMEKLTFSLARELAEQGVTVNQIAPGIMDTFRNRHYLSSEERRQHAAEHVPLGRVGQPADCAGLALLLSSEAGSYITGQSIYVDGGLGLGKW